MPPIPPPRESGRTRGTPHPLYWASWGPAGATRLVVLHGGPGAHHDYLLPQMLALSDEYDLFFYDQRGGGQSKTGDLTPITWQTHVADLAQVANEFEWDDLTLVGYSWGGLLAMLYATSVGWGAAAPRRMILIDPASPTRAFRDRFEQEFSRRLNSEWIRVEREALAASGMRERDPDAWRRRGFELSVAPYFAQPDLARDLTPFRVTSRVQQSVWESLGDFDLLPALRQLRVPTLVIHGRQDPIPLESSEQVATALSAKLVVLDDCGHVPYVEQPGPCFSAIRSFLIGGSTT